MNIKKQAWVSYSLLVFQIGVYIAMLLYQWVHFGLANALGEKETLLIFGAQWNTLIWQGQWWRLITPIFIHIGFEHLFLNSLTLYFVAPPLEKYMGHFKFLCLYLLSGIGGNVASLFFQSNQALSAGSSTALFGLFAYYVMRGYLDQGGEMKNASQIYFVFIILNIISNLFDASVSLSGHLGGLVTGAILACFLHKKGYKKTRAMI